MRTRKIALTASFGLLASLAAGEASAQGYQAPRPLVSPYINLLRRGSDPGVNYYGIVRPLNDQNQFNQSVVDQHNQLRQQVLTQQSPNEDAPLAEPVYPTTGHPTGLLNYQRYFMNRGSGAGVVAPAGGALGFANRTPQQGGASRGVSSPRGGGVPPGGGVPR